MTPMTLTILGSLLLSVIALAICKENSEPGRPRTFTVFLGLISLAVGFAAGVIALRRHQPQWIDSIGLFSDFVVFCFLLDDWKSRTIRSRVEDWGAPNGYRIVSVERRPLPVGGPLEEKADLVLTARRLRDGRIRKGLFFSGVRGTQVVWKDGDAGDPKVKPERTDQARA